MYGVILSKPAPLLILQGSKWAAWSRKTPDTRLFIQQLVQADIEIQALKLA